MYQFRFDVFIGISGILLTIFTILVTQKKLRSKSWWFLVFSLLFFIIAMYNSYQKSKAEIKPTLITNQQRIQSKDSTFQSTKIDTPIIKSPKIVTNSSVISDEKISKTQERLMKIENRAYITMQSLEFKIHSNDFIKVEYDIINTGKTPAHYVFPCGVVIIGDITDKFPNLLRGVVNRRDSTGFVIGVNMPLHRILTTDIKISIEDSIEVANNIKHIYLLGLTKYYDIFNERHCMWFCFNLFPDGSVIAYHKYNEVDRCE